MVERIKIEIECSKEFLREDDRGNITIPVFSDDSLINLNKGMVIRVGNQLDYKKILVEEIVLDSEEKYSKIIGREYISNI